MPSVKLLLNLGTNDAKKHGLEGDDAREGAVVDVPEDVAKSLLARGWATRDVDSATPDIPAPDPAAANLAEARLEGRPDVLRADEAKAEGEGEGGKARPAPTPPAERQPNRQGR